MLEAPEAAAQPRQGAVVVAAKHRSHRHRHFYVYRVYHTCANGGCGLHERTGPGYSKYRSVGLLNDGDKVKIVCQAAGEPVSGLNGTSSDVWDKLANGHWVADYYVDTPGMEGAFTEPIPRCGSSERAVLTTTCSPTSSRPQQLLALCGQSTIDYYALVESIHWSSFGGSSARGAGSLVVPNCEPSCEQGGFTRYRAHLLLGRPRFCAIWQVNEYTRAVVTAKRAPGSLHHIALDPYCGARQLGSFDYRAFDGHYENLTPWLGGHVAVLVEPQYPHTATAMTRLVGALDRAWSYYAAETGRLPAQGNPMIPNDTLNGRDVIAEVSSTPSNCVGCTYAGDDGTEILNCPGSGPSCDYFEYGYDEVAEHDLFDQIPFYELGHSFWFWSPQLLFQKPSGAPSTWQDPALFGQAVWMRFASMAAARVGGAPPFATQTPFSLYQYEVSSLAGEYEADTRLTFADTLAQDKAPGTQMCGSAYCTGTDLWASLMMQLAARHGGDAFISRFWRDVSGEPPETSNAGEVTNWERAASEAACTDLSSVFYTRWGFPRPDGSVTTRPPASTVPEPVGSCGTG